MRTLRAIWLILRYDVRKALGNVIGLVVLMGLVVVPSLYAWFNIAASWDPYSNTKGLKVAIANSDEGYKSDLVPVRINIGDTVISTLRANNQLDWQFVDEEKAVDGVNAGTYYAAVVIPKDFSKDMMTVFTPKITHAKLAYYINQKENAIAPKVTDKGAGTIATQIDQTFTTTVGRVALDTASNLSEYLGSGDATRFVNNLAGHVGDAADSLGQVGAQLDGYAGVMESTAGVVDGADTLIREAGGITGDAQSTLGDAQDGVDAIAQAIDSSADAIGKALDATDRSYGTVASAVDGVYADLGTDAADSASSLNGTASNLDKLAGSYDGLASSLKAYTETADAAGAGGDLQDAIDRIGGQAAKQRSLANALRSAASDVSGTATDADKQHDDLAKLIQQGRDGVAGLRSSFASDGGLKAQAGQLASSIQTAAGSVGSVATRLGRVSSGMSGSAESLSAGLRGMAGTLRDLRKPLDDASGKLASLRDNLTKAASGGDLAQVKSLLSSPNADQLASIFAAPVGVNRHPVFAIANYGSAMAPFYTILAIWVGGIVLVAMMRVALSDNEKSEVGRRLGAGTGAVAGLAGVDEAAGRAGTDARDERRAGAGAGAGLVGRVGAGAAAGAGRGGLLVRLRSWRGGRGASAAGEDATGAGAVAGLAERVDASAERAGERHAVPTLNQQYLGRFAIFALLALMQSGLVCMGDLWYLRIQCEHPFLFLLAGWTAGVVFCNIMYALTVSFGDVGKAIAVLLLVIQVAGSGGTFPIETLPPFFRALYPFLPFTHGVAAMHAAVAGPYGNEYWMELGKLALFLVPFLLLGLVLRRPVIRLNELIIRNLESTKVM